MSKNTFRLTVASLRGVVFQEQVESVYLFGAEGEFELLPYHYPLMASLVPGRIQIAFHESLPIRTGVVMFKENECTIVAEMENSYTQIQEGW